MFLFLFLFLFLLYFVLFLLNSSQIIRRILREGTAKFVQLIKEDAQKMWDKEQKDKDKNDNPGLLGLPTKPKQPEKNKSSSALKLQRWKQLDQTLLRMIRSAGNLDVPSSVTKAIGANLKHRLEWIQRNLEKLSKSFEKERTAEPTKKQKGKGKEKEKEEEKEETDLLGEYESAISKCASIFKKLPKKPQNNQKKNPRKSSQGKENQTNWSQVIDLLTEVYDNLQPPKKAVPPQEKGDDGLEVRNKEGNEEDRQKSVGKDGEVIDLLTKVDDNLQPPKKAVQPQEKGNDGLEVRNKEGNEEYQQKSVGKGQKDNRKGENQIADKGKGPEEGGKDKASNGKGKEPLDQWDDDLSSDEDDDMPSVKEQLEIAKREKSEFQVQLKEKTQLLCYTMRKKKPQLEQKVARLKSEKEEIEKNIQLVEEVINLLTPVVEDEEKKMKEDPPKVVLQDPPEPNEWGRPKRRSSGGPSSGGPSSGGPSWEDPPTVVLEDPPEPNMWGRPRRRSSGGPSSGGPSSGGPSWEDLSFIQQARAYWLHLANGLQGVGEVVSEIIDDKWSKLEQCLCNRDDCSKLAKECINAFVARSLQLPLGKEKDSKYEQQLKKQLDKSQLGEHPKATLMSEYDARIFYYVLRTPEMLGDGNTVVKSLNIIIDKCRNNFLHSFITHNDNYICCGNVLKGEGELILNWFSKNCSHDGQLKQHYGSQLQNFIDRYDQNQPPPFNEFLVEDFARIMKEYCQRQKINIWEVEGVHEGSKRLGKSLFRVKGEKILYIPKAKAKQERKNIKYFRYITWDAIVDNNDSELTGAKDWEAKDREVIPKNEYEIFEKLNGKTTYLVNSCIDLIRLSPQKSTIFMIARGADFDELSLDIKTLIKYKNKKDLTLHLVLGDNNEGKQTQQKLAKLAMEFSLDFITENICYDFDFLEAYILGKIGPQSKHKDDDLLFAKNATAKWVPKIQQFMREHSSNCEVFDLLTYDKTERQYDNDEEIYEQLFEAQNKYHLGEWPLPWLLAAKSHKVVRREGLNFLFEWEKHWDPVDPKPFVLFHQSGNGGTSAARMFLYDRRSTHVCLYISKPKEVNNMGKSFFSFMTRLSITGLPFLICIDPKDIERVDDALTLCKEICQRKYDTKLLLVLQDSQQSFLEKKENEKFGPYGSALLNKVTKTEARQLRECLKLRDRLYIKNVDFTDFLDKETALLDLKEVLNPQNKMKKDLLFDATNDDLSNLLEIEREMIQQMQQKQDSGDDRQVTSLKFSQMPSLKVYLGIQLLLYGGTHSETKPLRDQFLKKIKELVASLEETRASFQFLRLALFFSIYCPGYIIPEAVAKIYFATYREANDSLNEKDLNPLIFYLILRQGPGYSLPFTSISYMFLKECDQFENLRPRNVTNFLLDQTGLMADLEHSHSLCKHLQEGMVRVVNDFARWHGPPRYLPNRMITEEQYSYSFLVSMFKHFNRKDGIKILNQLTKLYASESCWPIFASRTAQLVCSHAMGKQPNGTFLTLDQAQVELDHALKILEDGDSNKYPQTLEAKGRIEVTHMRKLSRSLKLGGYPLENYEILNEIHECSKRAEGHYEEAMQMDLSNPHANVGLLRVWESLANAMSITLSRYRSGDFGLLKSKVSSLYDALDAAQKVNVMKKHIGTVLTKLKQNLDRWPSILVNVKNIFFYKKTGREGESILGKTKKKYRELQKKIADYLGCFDDKNILKKDPCPALASIMVAEIQNDCTKFPLEQVVYIVVTLSWCVTITAIRTPDLLGVFQNWCFASNWLGLHDKRETGPLIESYKSQKVECMKKMNSSQFSPVFLNEEKHHRLILTPYLNFWVEKEANIQRHGIMGHRFCILYYLWLLVVRQKDRDTALGGLQEAVQALQTILTKYEASSEQDRFCMVNVSGNDPNNPFCHFLDFSIYHEEESEKFIINSSFTLLKFAQKAYREKKKRFPEWEKLYHDHRSLFRDFIGVMGDEGIYCEELGMSVGCNCFSPENKQRIGKEVKFLLVLREQKVKKKKVVPPNVLFARAIVDVDSPSSSEASSSLPDDKEDKGKEKE